MSKFNIIATMHTISTLNTEIDAADLNNATIQALQNAKKDDWVIRKELKTTTK